MPPIAHPRKLICQPVDPLVQTDRFSLDEDMSPEQRFQLLDPDDRRIWGFVVVDDTQRGPGLGGIRMAPDVTLLEVMRLSRAMTLKNSASAIPFGGGKSGIVADPVWYSRHPQEKAELIDLFAEAVSEITDYYPAPDMGTNETDVQRIADKFEQISGGNGNARFVAGRPVEMGGVPIDEWMLTAHGLFAAAKTLEECLDHFSLDGAQVVIQGYGNVGSGSAQKLHHAGARIVGASDIHQALWNPKGLDVHQLNEARLQPGGLSNYSGKTERRFSGNKLDWLLEAPCDILLPAARPDAITSRNADRIQCRVILQGANTPTNKMTDFYLENRRNILSLSDFIVNVGGVIGCAVEIMMQNDSEYHQRVQEVGVRKYTEDLIFNAVSSNMRTIFKRLIQNKSALSFFREEAIKFSEELLKSPEIVRL